MRDVIAHVIRYDGLDTRALLALAARGRFLPGRINAAALTRYDTTSRSNYWPCWPVTCNLGSCPRRSAAGITTFGLAGMVTMPPGSRRAIITPASAVTVSRSRPASPARRWSLGRPPGRRRRSGRTRKRRPVGLAGWPMAWDGLRQACPAEGQDWRLG